MTTKKFEGFITYLTYRTENNNSYVYLFGRLKDGRSFCTRNKYTPYFFIKKTDAERAKKQAGVNYEETNIRNFRNEILVKILANSVKEVPDIRKSLEELGIDCYEADIRFAYRYLIDNGIRGAVTIKGEPKDTTEVRTDVLFEEPILTNGEWRPTNDNLKILSIDIEMGMDLKEIYCISLYSNDTKLNEVLIVSDNKLKNAISFKDEKTMLIEFRRKLLEYDPDIITGWNLIDFDFKILQEFMKKYKLQFDLGRTSEDASLKITTSFMTDSKADFPGRVVLDGIHLLKTSFIRLDDYKLGTAAKEFTKEHKLIGDENKGEEIEEAYKSNQQKLVDYNLLDSKLVIEIIKNSGAIDLTILRSLLTGMPLDRVRASIASFDSLYLKALREKGFAAPSGRFVADPERTTGGYVMSSKPGIYNYVIVLDFKSLYPSIMRTFNIDPLMWRPHCKKVFETEDLLKAPNGACFSKTPGILPTILTQLWTERDAAKKRKDELSRWAIKILMNSMYGVLASPNCRFYSHEIANAITGFGHQMIKNTSKMLQEQGLEVIYGDTDSIFVNLNVKTAEEAETLGRKLEKDINAYYKKKIKDDYGVDSVLEIEFEKTFRKFLMPKVRGSEEGAKKRYAGLLIKDGKERMDFTGLEFVRRDWTEVSKKFQLELLELIFNDKPIDKYVKKFIDNLKKGEYDDLLVYRKALRKDVEEYTKTTPPHVKAARLLGKITSNIIEYVMTVDGPEPVSARKHNIDYDHYIDKQLKPIADAVLVFFNQKFEDVVKGSEQKGLFDFH